MSSRGVDTVHYPRSIHAGRGGEGGVKGGWLVNDVRYVPGVATAVWGPRIAVLVGPDTAETLAEQLVALIALPETCTREVLDLLVAQHSKVCHFSVAEELADSQIQLVLRGRAASRVDGTPLYGGGMWRGRVIASAGAVELYDVRTADADHPRRARDRENATSVLASALVIRPANSTPVDPRPRRAMPPKCIEKGSEKTM